MRKRPVVLTVLFAIVLLVALLLLQQCGPPDGGDTASTRGAELPQQTSYPGASFILDIAPEPDTNGAADHGDVAVSRDGESFIYVAPFDSSNDTYRIVDASTGKPVAEGSVAIPISATAELELLELTPGKQVSARYGDVHIEAVLEDGVATASYRHIDSDEQISISVSISAAGQEASIAWRDTALDGYGALTAVQADALQAISTGPLARALTMTTLDLGCIDRPFDIPGEIYTALLFPWQMILKYEVARRDPVVRHFMNQSQCSFPGHLGNEQTKPQNIAVLWDVDHSVPMVHEAFPFDGVGQFPPLPL